MNDISVWWLMPTFIGGWVSHVIFGHLFGAILRKLDDLAEEFDRNDHHG